MIVIPSLVSRLISNLVVIKIPKGTHQKLPNYIPYDEIKNNWHVNLVVN